MIKNMSELKQNLTQVTEEPKKKKGGISLLFFKQKHNTVDQYTKHLFLLQEGHQNLLNLTSESDTNTRRT